MLVIEALSASCSVTGRIAVETNMGAVSAIMAYGSEDQKKMAAAMVLDGDKPAICITEPEAGSDASGMTTRADRKGNRFVVNGRKHWITGGGRLAPASDPSPRFTTRRATRKALAASSHPRRDPGTEDRQARAHHGPARHSEAEIAFEDMDLPPSALVIRRAACARASPI